MKGSGQANFSQIIITSIEKAAILVSFARREDPFLCFLALVCRIQQKQRWVAEYWVLSDTFLHPAFLISQPMCFFRVYESGESYDPPLSWERSQKISSAKLRTWNYGKPDPNNQPTIRGQGFHLTVKHPVTPILLLMVDKETATEDKTNYSVSEVWSHHFWCRSVFCYLDFMFEHPQKKETGESSLAGRTIAHGIVWFDWAMLFGDMKTQVDLNLGVFFVIGTQRLKKCPCWKNFVLSLNTVSCSLCSTFFISRSLIPDKRRLLSRE